MSAGWAEGELKSQIIGGSSHSCIGQLPFLFFSAMPNVVQYVRHRPAHILVQNRRDRPRRFYRVGQKVRKNFEFFTISSIYVHISQKLIKTEAYKLCMEKMFIPPLSKCRICMDQSLTGFYRVGQKLCDAIPVLRITPRATEPSTVSFFLSSVNCSRICRAQTSTLAKGFLQDGPKVRKEFEFRTISSLHVPYISVTAKNTGSQAAYVAFW